MITYGRLCTDTPGVITETGPHIVLCPPEAGCTDAVVTPGARKKWRTAAGTTAAAWYRKRCPNDRDIGTRPTEARGTDTGSEEGRG